MTDDPRETVFDVLDIVNRRLPFSVDRADLAARIMNEIDLDEVLIKSVKKDAWDRYEDVRKAVKE